MVVFGSWAGLWWPSFVLLVAGVQSENSFEPSFSQYPVILNYEGDKAVLFGPQQGCTIVVDSQDAELIDLQRIWHIYKEDGETLNHIISLCEQYRNESITATQFLLGVRDKAVLIYPGTKWCGAGNRATNFSDLGAHEETDKCCRAHDLCQDYVGGFSCHGTIEALCNRSPFTRSNCECDEKFRRCLLETKEHASRRIGVLFFTVFGLKCFRKDFPIISCLEYGGFLSIHCQKYELNYRGEPFYQFFDSPKYTLNESGISWEEESDIVSALEEQGFTDFPILTTRVPRSTQEFKK